MCTVCLAEMKNCVVHFKIALRKVRCFEKQKANSLCVFLPVRVEEQVMMMFIYIYFQGSLQLNVLNVIH